MTIGDHFVEWATPIRNYRFPLKDYRTWVQQAATDHSWEDTNRRCERLVSNVLAGMVLPNGKPFQWASARTNPRKIALSFNDDGGQRLMFIGWDGQDPDTAVVAAKIFRSKQAWSFASARRGGRK